MSLRSLLGDGLSLLGLTIPQPKIDRVHALDAAAGGRRTKGWGQTPSQQADIRGLGPRVASRARYLADNSPLIASAVKTFCSSVVGTGLRLIPQTGSPDLDARIVDQFEAWTDRCDVTGRQSAYGMQGTLAERYFVDGEGWLHLIAGADGELRLQLWDPAQIDPALSRDLPGGGCVVSGVEVNAQGLPIGYWVYKDYIPGIPLLRGLTPVRVDADDVLHFYHVHAAGQCRGLSSITPSVLKAFELDALGDGLLVNLKVASMTCGVVVDAGGAVLADEAGRDPALPSLEPGTMMRLQPGEDIRFLNGAQVGEGVNDHVKSVIREVCSGMGLPSFLVDGNMSDTNFSAARVGLTEWKRKVEAIQDHFAFQILRPLYRRWATLEILSGRINAPLNERALKHRWIPPKTEYLDPEKDANAAVLLINAGLLSRREACASLGISVEDLDKQIASDRAREKSLGLDFRGGDFSAKPAPQPQQQQGQQQ